MKFFYSFFIAVSLLLLFPRFLPAQYFSLDDTIHPGIKSVITRRCSFTSKGDSSCVKINESDYDEQGRIILFTTRNVSTPGHDDTLYVQYTEKGNQKTKKVLFHDDEIGRASC